MGLSNSSSPETYVLTLFFTITAVHLIIHTHSSTHRQDVQVLKQLKSTINPATVPPASCIDSWDFSFDPCDNLFTEKFTCGFRCDVVSNSSRVTELTLDSPGYSGSLDAVSWTGVPYLQNLDLSNNGFTGPIPDSFSGLTRLTRLGLSHNSLSGSVPASLGSLTALEEVHLDGNLLNGTIPLGFNGLKNLVRLEIQGNQLSGAFPELSQLGSLTFLDASDNAFSGEISAALPPALVELVMRNNQLEGSIPASAVATLASLQVIDLSHNRLTGSVPASLFTHPSLEQLTLSYNQLEWVEVPSDSGLVLSQLISVDLSNNQARGFLPGFLGLMPRLSALSLENNKFSGFIPAQYVLKVLATDTGQGVAQFERLLLGGNYLYGPIPGEFLGLKAGSVTVRLGDNCLYRCPLRWFFCQGGEQKSLLECRAFGPIIHG